MSAIRFTARSLTIAVAGLTVGACATEPKTSGPNLCSELTKFAANERSHGGGYVELGRKGQWLVDHVKSCQRKDDDPAGVAFCHFLMDETTTEFMESTVTTAMACLQDQRIVGYTGNTGISEWEGKARFYAPRIDVTDVEIELSWRITAGSGAWDDFMRFSIMPTK